MSLRESQGFSVSPRHRAELQSLGTSHRIGKSDPSRYLIANPTQPNINNWATKQHILQSPHESQQL